MAQFGPAETSERRLNFAQSFNPPGTILGVIVGGQFIFSGVELKAPEVAAMKEQIKNAPEFDESTYRSQSYRDELGGYYR